MYSVKTKQSAKTLTFSTQTNVVYAKDVIIKNGFLLADSIQSSVDLIGSMMTRRFIYNRARVFLFDFARWIEHCANQIPIIEQ